ncbi:MAG TPA: Crp/Fnr family transcriptional regulator [Gammaproteobacteria bacterium]|nr:Crp/Fnr family transcriptional regulator [Gammaproteobacteria bacterium]
MTESTDIDTELRESYLFSSLDESQLDRVKRSLRILQLTEGQHLFDHGQNADRFFLVRRGQIKLYRISMEGAEKVVEIVQPGESFAEAIMFMDRQTYPVSADALTEAELFAFDSRIYRTLLRESVETCFQLMGAMSMRLRLRLNELNALTLQNATFRLAHYLLSRIPESGGAASTIELPAPKNIIASRLSIQPETLSRILHNLSRQKIITVQGRSIQIHDRERLASYLG